MDIYTKINNHLFHYNNQHKIGSHKWGKVGKCHYKK
jgi:hypothetical protein